MAPGFKHLSRFLLITALSCVVACNQPKAGLSVPKNNALIGSWEVQEIHWVSPGQTRSNVPSQMGILIVDKNRYSLMWTPISTPRVPFVVLANPTDEETKAGFNSIAFNSGSYESTDSTFTTTARIAKVPGFEGGKQFFRYHIESGILTLSMFDEIYPDGKKPAWSGKLEAKLILKRVEQQ